MSRHQTKNCWKSCFSFASTLCAHVNIGLTICIHRRARTCASVIRMQSLENNIRMCRSMNLFIDRNFLAKWTLTECFHSSRKETLCQGLGEGASDWVYRQVRCTRHLTCETESLIVPGFHSVSDRKACVELGQSSTISCNGLYSFNCDTCLYQS